MPPRQLAMRVLTACLGRRMLRSSLAALLKGEGLPQEPDPAPRRGELGDDPIDLVYKRTLGRLAESRDEQPPSS